MLQHTAPHSIALQHTATHQNNRRPNTSYCSHIHAKHCNARPHTATHCYTLQHTATHLHKRRFKYTFPPPYPYHTLQRTATHCNALQHTATHLNNRRPNTSYRPHTHARHCNALLHTATHCNTLQHTWIIGIPIHLTAPIPMHMPGFYSTLIHILKSQLHSPFE